MKNTKGSSGIWIKLKVAIVLTFIILVVEIVGGVLSGSLALLTDAGHVFMDITALALTFGALGVSMKPATHKATYGHHRVEIVVALTNSVILFILSLTIIYNAYLRFVAPLRVESLEMVIFAIVGFCVNLYVAWNLHGYENLNVRSAYLHVFGDTISSLAVIIGGSIIAISSLYWVDPAASILIAGIIIYRCVVLMKESGDILLERTPRHVDLKEIASKLRSVEGVDDIHDLHVWSICSNVHVMTAHVLVGSELMQNTSRVLQEMNRIASRYRIQHATFQVECEECEASESCELPHTDLE